MVHGASSMGCNGQAVVEQQLASSCLLPSYELLGVEADASEQDVRKAFESLAKRWHPDNNEAVGAAARFRAIVEAYAAIRAARRGRSTRSWIKDGRPWPPVACRLCGEAIAVPHSTEYVAVASFLLWTRRYRTVGFFCERCDARAAFDASLTSAIFGWWSIQGIVLTPLSVVTNAAGGKRDRAKTIAAFCRNVLAYHAAGDLLTVRYLSAVLSREHASVPVEVRLAMSRSDAGEADISLGHCFSGNARTRSRWFQHLALLAPAPTFVAVVLTMLI